MTERIRLSPAQIECLKHAVICGRIFDNGHPRWRSVLALERLHLLDRPTPGQNPLRINDAGLKQLYLNDRLGWERAANGRPMAVELVAVERIEPGDRILVSEDGMARSAHDHAPERGGARAKAAYLPGDHIFLSSRIIDGRDITHGE